MMKSLNSLSSLGSGGNTDVKMSFFDDINAEPSKSLFENLTRLELEESLPKRVADFILLERGEKFGTHHDRFITLTQKYLHVFENKERTVYLKSLAPQFTKMSYYFDEFSNNKTILSFNKNGLTEEFLTRNNTDLEKIQNHLRRVTVSTDFESRFEIVSLLGEGTFAEVHKVTQKSTKIPFAAKVYHLKNLSKNSEVDFAILRDCVRNEIKIMRQ
jgi:hypothetical protein